MDTFIKILGPVAGLLATAVVAWLGHRYTTPTDHDRAVLLSKLAEDAAAFVYSLNPNAAWADMVRDIVARLSAGAGVPTTNATALESAASAALLKLGKAPAAGK